MSTRRIITRYGTIYHSSTCKDHDNIETSDQYVKESGEVQRRARNGPAITLQRPALKSFKVAEAKADQEIVVTGTIRTCSQQATLYASDPQRFAHPNTTLHTQGLAIDVHTGFLNERVRRALRDCGWNQSRPDDEPWHFSFKLEA
jgi:hypothetical protein